MTLSRHTSTPMPSSPGSWLWSLIYQMGQIAKLPSGRLFYNRGHDNIITASEVQSVAHTEWQTRTWLPANIDMRRFWLAPAVPPAPILNDSCGYARHCSQLTPVATLRIQFKPVFRCSSLNALDSGSGREIPAICHATGVWHGHFYPRILVLGMGRF